MNTLLPPALHRLFDTLNTAEPLPSQQLRNTGIVYQIYRLLISTFFVVTSVATAHLDSSLLVLPSLMQQLTLLFYVLLSVFSLGLFYFVPHRPRLQLAIGFVLDIIVISIMLYTNGAADLQLIMLYMVVVAASFMMLSAPQAFVITMIAIIFVVYQQFFYAIANVWQLQHMVNALLMSASFLAVGFLSWSVSQRLVQMEKITAEQAKEVERLHSINQEVISQMVSGVLVVNQTQLLLANQAALRLLQLPSMDSVAVDHAIAHSSFSKTTANRHTPSDHQPSHVAMQRLQQQHPRLVSWYHDISHASNNTFVYELPRPDSKHTATKLRISRTHLKDHNQLLILEDLRREQASAQQLKLASLGQLTASIAHEIRNPLAAISQASQLLIEDSNTTPNSSKYSSLDRNSSVPAPSCDNNLELYEMIFLQTKRVNRIIEDVLKLSRQQRPNQQPLACQIWIENFLHNNFPNADIALHAQCNPQIMFDAHQLEQIINNLLHNAIRHANKQHTPANHTPTVTPPHAVQPNVQVELYCIASSVIIDILDEGDGVDEKDIAHLFDPFFTTDRQGTGLGLYLAQAFTEANHSQLLYVAEHQKTCFRLIIPSAKASDTGNNHSGETNHE